MTSVEVHRKQSRVIVTGHVEPNKVLNRVKSTGKRVEFWPYVPYNLVSYPYATQAYDKRDFLQHSPNFLLSDLDQKV